VLSEFAETSMLVEFICLTSLLLLCTLRRFMVLRPFPGWLQRILCGVVPAVVSGVLLAFLLRQDWFVYSFPHLRWGSAVFVCFCIGVVLQHYLELRTKAFSPALVEAKLQALQARIRPHFLFNSLNAVLSLIRSEPRRAETALEDLADLFRLLMRDTRDMTSLGEEIKLCEQYLGIEKIRLDQRLMIQWSIQNLSQIELQTITIPSLLLQPLVENAVHYGVEPCLMPSLITN